MSPLCCLAMLLFIWPQDLTLPDEYQQIPEQVRSQATIIVSGTFWQGRGPCMWMPDGSRRWALESGFEVKQVYRGRVGARLIYINRAELPNSGYVSRNLVAQQRYLVLLRPATESLKLIKSGKGVTFWDALHDEEIIAIVELK